MFRSVLSTSTTLALGTGSLLLLSGPATPTAPMAVQQDLVPTAFALQASGFGTLARGGDVPAGSDGTARAVIACTNKAGIQHSNYEAEAAIPGFGTLSGVRTTTTTTRYKGVVASTSRHSITSVELVKRPSLGKLAINGLTSLSRAYHDTHGFHATTATAIGSITFTPPGGQPQEQALPTPGQPLVVPGLAKISVGTTERQRSSQDAEATAETVRVKVMPTDTVVKLAHTHARIDGGVKSGLFSGWSSGSDLRAVDDIVSSGRSPLKMMPCQGTDGTLEQASIAYLDLGHNVVARGLNADQWSDQTPSLAEGYEQGKIARLRLGGGDVIVRGIVGRVNVLLSNQGVSENAKGTTVGKVIVNGEARKFPDSDTLTIPGVAKLQRYVVDRSGPGISVIALRVTVLDGTGAVMNLGRARLSVKDSGL